MTVSEAIQHLEALKGCVPHEAMPGALIALSMAIAVFKALSAHEVKVVNALYDVNFEPNIKF